MGRIIGNVVYAFDHRHRAIVHSNIKKAMGENLTTCEISRITKNFYQGLGQSIMEVFLIPTIDKRYLERYVTIDGLENIYDGFKNGKGVILMVVHEGSWELSNIVSSLQGFPFSVIVRDQGLKRLDKMLNKYRRQKGTKTIEKEHQLQKVIHALKNNEAVAMTIDQGGAGGVHVKFFGKDASMASGALRLALKYDSVLLPVFFSRIKGPYAKITIHKPVEITKTGNLEIDLRNNLQGILFIFEKHILKYPREYLWTYKIWKYSFDKDILVLWDGLSEHLKQAKAVAEIAAAIFQEKGMKVKIEFQEVKLKNRFWQICFALVGFLSGKFSCQGCLLCLNCALRGDLRASLIKSKPDLVISCGSSLAGVNFILARENLAKSIVVMKPRMFDTKKFDLVIIPRHDNPYKNRNITITEGTLNLINEKCLKDYSMQLGLAPGNYIGFLMGGDTKKFSANKEEVRGIIRQLKEASENLNAGLLIVTSCCTSKEIESLIKEEFGRYHHTKLLVIANEKNIPEAVGGILGLSSIVVIFPESISMISEAATSGKYVLVCDSTILSRKDRDLLDYFSERKYIYLSKKGDLAQKIRDISINRPHMNVLSDNLLVREAIARIL